MKQPQLPMRVVNAAIAAVLASPHWYSSPATAMDLVPYFYIDGFGDEAFKAKDLMTAMTDGDVYGITVAFGVAENSSCTLNAGMDAIRTNPTIIDDFNQYLGSGGSLILSFGGAAGTYLEQVCTAQQMHDIIRPLLDKYGIHAIDFDVEGGSLNNTALNATRNAAILLLQEDDPELSVSFTLPVMPDGLPDTALNLLRTTAAAGVNITIVNIMAMDYGDSPDLCGNMGVLATQAGDAVFNQLKPLFPDLNDADVWGMIGITPMIGHNDIACEIFTENDACLIGEYAANKGLGRLSFWNIQRDQVGTGDLYIYSQTNSADYQYYKNMSICSSAPTVPTAVTLAATGITATSATLKGTVTPNRANTTVTFDFGTTTAYGQNLAVTPASIAATAGATAVSANKTGLNCGTTYHFRTKAVNSVGTALGADKVFTTAACSIDWVITNAVLTPLSPVANATFSAAVTVKNQGTSAGDGGQLRLWANQPTVQVCAATGGDKNIAVGAIAAGASKVLTFTGLNAGIGGIKTLRSLVDATCVRVETNETNNQFVKTYRVTGKPDFVVTSMIVTPATPAVNGNFTLAVILKNQGTAAGDGGYLDVWNNLATVPACGAVGNAWADVGALAAGASKEVINVTALNAGAAGAKTLRAFVDSWCETTESQETNNQLTKAYTVP